MAADTYVVNIPAEALCGYDESYSEMEDNPSDITLTWTIASSGSQYDWSFTANPEAGEVTSLSTVKLTFSGFDEIEIPTKDDLYVTYNGEKMTRVKAKATYTESIQFVFDAEKTAPGTYEFVIPAGTISGWLYSDDDATEVPNQEEIKVVYTIAGSAEDLSFDYTLSVPTEGVKNELSEAVLTFSELDQVSILEAPAVTVDGSAPEADKFTVDAAVNKLTLTFEPQIEAGVVDIKFAAGAIHGKKGSVSQNNLSTVEFGYVLGKPVVYDLDATIASPKMNAAGEISANRQLDAFFFEVPVKGLVLGSLTSNVTIKQTDGDFEATTTLVKGNGLNAGSTYFVANFSKEPTYNGEYVITIAKGSYGNQVWKADAEYGRSNEMQELKFTLVDGVSGIDTISDDTTGETVIYNLQGIRVNSIENLPAGVYIVNGKKVRK